MAELGASSGTKGRVVSEVELNARTDDAMQYIEYQKGNEWIWPENLGFQGEITEGLLPIATRVDRFGGTQGSFMSPEGITLETRAMAPGSSAETLHVYEVIKPLPVIQGKVAPAFGQAGGGLQMLPNLGFKVNVQWLIDNQYIKEVAK